MDTSMTSVASLKGTSKSPKATPKPSSMETREFSEGKTSGIDFYSQVGYEPARGPLTSLSLQKSSSMGSTKKSLCEAELKRDTFWRHIRHSSEHEEKSMEDRWDSRHHVRYSSANCMINPNTRDYFDRPRERPNTHVKFYTRPVERWHPTWNLCQGVHGIDLPDGDIVKEITKGRSSWGSTGQVRKRPGWNDRHYVTHSVGNPLLHENTREYFGRFVEPKRERLLTQRNRGITKHSCHRRSRVPGGEDGKDDDPSPLEKLLDEGDDDFDTPPPSLNTSIMSKSQSTPSFAERRPMLSPAAAASRPTPTATERSVRS